MSYYYQYASNPDIQLIITTQPAFHSGATSVTFGTSPVVKAYFADGTTVADGYTGTVTAALVTANGATLGTTVSVACVAGVATFDDLDIDTAGAYQLVFTADGLTSATSDWFMVGGSLLLRSDVGVTGNPMSAWADQSGSGNDAAADLGNRPAVTAVPSLDMGGEADDEFFKIPSFRPTNTAAKTIFVICKPATGQSFYGLFGTLASFNAGIQSFATSDGLVIYGFRKSSANAAQWIGAVATMQFDQWQSLTVVHDGTLITGSVKYYGDGALAETPDVTNADDAGVNGAADLMFGTRIDSASGLHFLGEWAVTIYFAEALSDDRVAAVHNALRQEVAGFATPITLPTS